MRKIIISMGLITACSCVAVVSAQDQNQFNGVDIFATGENPPLDGFSPGNTPGLQLRDDGTNGDATPDDGIYSVDFQIAPNTEVVEGQRFQWKVASSGFAPVSYPFGTDNGFSRFLPGNMKFVFDTQPKADGFNPDPNGSNILGILYTIPSPVLPTDAVRLAGSFGSELGGNDWTNDDDLTRMLDDGTGDDETAGDGIYTFSFTGVPAGGYEFKIVLNANWDLQVSAIGFATGGSNIALNVAAATDNIKILFDSNTGRVKIENDNPLVNPGPPFYGTSAAWSEQLGAATQLYDDGTNGDVTANDGIHSRVFTTVDSGQMNAQVKQGQGPSYPESGGYPMNIATTGQLVLLQFDTNSMTDGYSPATRYMWTDPASRYLVSAVQAVGSFQDEFGGAEWDANDPNFNLSDAGTEGDLTAADMLFGKDFIAFAGVSGAQYKAVIPPGWDFQFGGAGNGFTRNGNNPAITFTATAGQTANFQVDAITGRIAAFVNTTPVAPSRPASINALPMPSNVSDWAIY